MLLKFINVEHFEMLVTLLASILASSGFWVYNTHRTNLKDFRSRLLIGLAHDRIVALCVKYIERGYITHDEHENLVEFLYKPYSEIGGNGSAKRLMDEVAKLPIKLSEYKGESI